MKHFLLIALLSLSLGACDQIRKLPGFGKDTPPQATDTSDLTFTGTTKAVNDVVYLPVKGRLVTVQIKRAGAWVTLEGQYRDYIAFIFPGEGVRFMNGSAPAGTDYKIESTEVQP